MYKKLFIIGLVFLCYTNNGFGQPISNTAAELEIIRLINSLRIDPPRFAREVLEPYHLSYPTAQTYNLMMRLRNLYPLRPFAVKLGLNQSALEMALLWSKAGENGGRPLPSPDDRIHRWYPGARRYATSQITGQNSPKSVLVNLLLGDLTTDSLPNYLPVLDPNMVSVGVSLKPYLPDCSITVIDFSEYRPEAPIRFTLTEEDRKKRDTPIDECPPGAKVLKRKIGKPKTLR